MIDWLVTGWYLFSAAFFITVCCRYAPKETRWVVWNWLIMVINVAVAMWLSYQFVVHAQRL